MATKQIVVDGDLHRQFHQDCVRKGVTMRSATERLIRQTLEETSDPDTTGDDKIETTQPKPVSLGGCVEENLEKMYVDSAASAATGGPMLRYGGDDGGGDAQQLLPPRSIKVHDDKSDW